MKLSGLMSAAGNDPLWFWGKFSPLHGWAAPGVSCSRLTLSEAFPFGGMRQKYPADFGAAQFFWMACS
jgi:hypothetical protein